MGAGLRRGGAEAPAQAQCQTPARFYLDAATPTLSAKERGSQTRRLSVSLYSPILRPFVEAQEPWGEPRSRFI